MQTFVTIRRSEVPKFLHISELYLSLDENDDELSVPSDCMKRNAHVNNLIDLKNMLFTMRYWILTSFPNGLIKFLVNPLNIGVTEILDEFQEAFPRLMPMIKSLHNAMPRDKCNISAQFGCIDFLEYFCEKEGLPLSEQTMRNAAAKGHVDCLAYCHNWLLKKDSSFVPDEFYVQAVVKAGHLDCLKYLVEHGASIPQRLYCVATLSGQLPCLKYLMTRCELLSDSYNVISAILQGNHVSRAKNLQAYTDCLKYLLDNVVLHPGRCALVTTACQYGNVLMLKLMHQRGFPFGTELVNVAAHAGNLECLHILHDSLHFDCWVPATMAAAAGAGQLKLVQHLHEMGCAWDESAPIAAKLHCREECLVFLLQQRGIPESAAFRNTPSDILCRLSILEYYVAQQKLISKQSIHKRFRKNQNSSF